MDDAFVVLELLLLELSLDLLGVKELQRIGHKFEAFVRLVDHAEGLTRLLLVDSKTSEVVILDS